MGRTMFTSSDLTILHTLLLRESNPRYISSAMVTVSRGGSRTVLSSRYRRQELLNRIRRFAELLFESILNTSYSIRYTFDMARTSVGILRGGTSSEYDLSLKSGGASEEGAVLYHFYIPN